MLYNFPASLEELAAEFAPDFPQYDFPHPIPTALSNILHRGPQNQRIKQESIFFFVN